MNKTSHTDEPFDMGDGYNQSPNPLSKEFTTNQDFNGIANSRQLTGTDSGLQGSVKSASPGIGSLEDSKAYDLSAAINQLEYRSTDRRQQSLGALQVSESATDPAMAQLPLPSPRDAYHRSAIQQFKRNFLKICSFIGPGFMIAVAYIDPGNYATDVAAGASYRFRLLFVVLLANLIAIFLQSLAIKLGTVTGLDLAEACRAFLPRWLNYILYAFAEVAIIATDIAEVIGFAIALNLLIPKVPLVAGCAISILDVMVILLFYRPEGSMKALRVFELFVISLVLGVVVCFCIQMSLIRNTTVGEVFKGYLPTNTLVQKQALYQACGILGATVMPHSLYLGSGIVHSRLREFDKQRNLLPHRLASGTIADEGIDKGYYVPSLDAIRHSLKFSILELAVSLFTFALFVNSAILVVAGASLSNNSDALDADIFGIHDLLSRSISKLAGTIFALALLLSGVSAGVICTIAGQMVSEGALNWKIRPWLRRLVTRSISIIPSIIIAGAVGRQGLDTALNATQVALSVVLPFVSAPLLYFTSRNKYMRVRDGRARWIVAGNDTENDEDDAGEELSRGVVPLSQSQVIDMTNSWLTIIIAAMLWLFLAIMNAANLALLGKS